MPRMQRMIGAEARQPSRSIMSLIPHANRALGQFLLIVRQGMGLHVVNHLQFVLHIPKKPVGFDKPLELPFRQQPVGMEPFQRGQGLPTHDPWKMRPRNDLNRLNEKLDLANASDS